MSVHHSRRGKKQLSDFDLPPIAAIQRTENKRIRESHKERFTTHWKLYLNNSLVRCLSG